MPVRLSSSPPRWIRGTETVLLAEDEREVRRAIAEVLTECGYRVHAASTPLEALAIAEGHPDAIHLLVTDVLMPQMGGSELAQKVVVARPRIRVLFMSGY